MKTLLLGGAALALAMTSQAAIAQPSRPPICLRTQDMVDTTPDDQGASITFRMRDGSVWRNELRGRCPDLRFNGFVWVVQNPDQTVCDDVQSLRVLRSGEICMLGKFTPVKPPRGRQGGPR